MTKHFSPTSLNGWKQSKRVSSLQETHQLAKEFGAQLSSGALVFLKGDLGAGKTTFVKGVVEGLGGDPTSVHSPTYNFLNLYDVTPPVFHFDLYRLKNEEEFIEAGFIDHLDEEGICCIEWPERIPSFEERATYVVTIIHLENGSREIIIS